MKFLALFILILASFFLGATWSSFTTYGSNFSQIKFCQTGRDTLDDQLARSFIIRYTIEKSKNDEGLISNPLQNVTTVLSLGEAIKLDPRHLERKMEIVAPEGWKGWTYWAETSLGTVQLELFSDPDCYFKVVQTKIE